MPAPGSRTSLAALARLLDECDAPVYAVDGQREIVYANAACAAWTGLAGDELVGLRCHYAATSAAASRPADIAGALCPPPEAFAGKPVERVIVLPTAAPPSARRARFVPLGDASGESLGAVAFVAAADSREEPAGPRPTEPAALHEWIARFHAAQQARYTPESLLGRAAGVERARQQIRLASATSANVLFVGPAGVGKEHAARSVYFLSSREPAAALLPIQCDELNEDLLAAALDAALRSARESPRPISILLTGADRLSAELQTQLVARIGQHSSRLRFLATAAVDLNQLAAAGGYRPDLAARLSTLVIELPALSARVEDLPVLAQAFLERENVGAVKQLSGFTADALERLALHPWPGNVAELIEVVVQARARAEGPVVLASDLPDRFRQIVEARARPPVEDEKIVLEDFLAKIELELIQRALARAKGNKTRAAELLGLNRPRLYRRLVQLGLINEREDTNEPAAAPDDESIDFQE